MHTYTPTSSVFGSPKTNLLSILCILTEILSCAHAERAKSLNDFKFGIAIGRFPSDGAVSMAVKGLTLAITTLAAAFVSQTRGFQPNQLTFPVVLSQNNSCGLDYINIQTHTLAVDVLPAM